MPSGQTHRLATMAVTVVLAVQVPYLLDPLGWAAFALPMGSLSGLVLTNDLDQNTPTISHWLIEKHTGAAGGIFRMAWTLFWMPYSKAIRHRSWMSHGPIVGTLIRVGYILALNMLAGMLGSLLFSVDAPMDSVLSFYRDLIGSPLFLSWLLGLTLSDLVHTLMDWIL